MTDCKICGSDMMLATCHYCHGEGGWHDCGEDCCPCADPDIDVICPECEGDGEYFECPALPHTEKQMEAYRLRVAAGVKE